MAKSPITHKLFKQPVYSSLLFFLALTENWSSLKANVSLVELWKWWPPLSLMSLTLQRQDVVGISPPFSYLSFEVNDI